MDTQCLQTWTFSNHYLPSLSLKSPLATANISMETISISQSAHPASLPTGHGFSYSVSLIPATHSRCCFLPSPYQQVHNFLSQIPGARGVPLIQNFSDSEGIMVSTQYVMCRDWEYAVEIGNSNTLIFWEKFVTHGYFWGKKICKCSHQVPHEFKSSFTTTRVLTPNLQKEKYAFKAFFWILEFQIRNCGPVVHLVYCNRFIFI